MINIFLTGASGYIGGTVFHNLVQNKEYTITVLVRKEEQAKKFKDLGAQVVIASLDDSSAVKEASSRSDVVINIADSDHLESSKAIVAGLQERAKKGGKKPILIHTSGTGVLMDLKETVGEKADQTYSESQLGDINGVDQQRFHRLIDIEILKGGESGSIDTIIICPPLIYGTGTGPYNTHSVQLPVLIQTAIVYKQAYHAGRGTNIWHNIHVLDLVDLYTIVLENALKGTAPVNRDGYYFAENGTHNFLELTDEIARILHSKGIVQSAKSQDLASDEKHKKLFMYTGFNSRGKSEKGKKLGWNPHRPSLIQSVAEEVDYWLTQKPETYNISR